MRQTEKIGLGPAETTDPIAIPTLVSLDSSTQPSRPTSAVQHETRPIENPMLAAKVPS